MESNKIKLLTEIALFEELIAEGDGKKLEALLTMREYINSDHAKTAFQDEDFTKFLKRNKDNILEAQLLKGRNNDGSN